MRTGKELIAQTRPFARENRAKSWSALVITLSLVALLTALAGALPSAWPWWLLRGLLSLLAGLTIVRGFILYHDTMHGAIFRNQRWARGIMKAYGVLVLTPPKVWRQTHNYHHAHTAKIVGSHVGSYMVLTVEMWKNRTTRLQRVLYRISRHPLTVLFGYLFIFLYGMCLASFLRNPKKNLDSLAALLVHVALVLTLGLLFDWTVPLFALVLPLFVACAAGGYLFYAQHNFEEMHIQPRHEWSYTRAALESSSFLKMGRIMNWFTGNIGYHHVHHLNPAIPFYNLPLAMAEIPELQNPGTTTLSPKEILRCFRLKLWDPDRGRMVGYP